MRNYSKAYFLDNDKQKIYNGVLVKEFTIPKDAKGYKDYIDALYKSASEISPSAVLSGVDVVADAMISRALC